MLRNWRGSIVDHICHLRWLETPGSPAHVNVSPSTPFEDLIHPSVSAQRDPLDGFLVTDDFQVQAVGFRLHACYA